MDESLLPPHLPCMIRAEQTHLRIPSRPDWIGPTAEFLQHKAVLCGACPAERGERLLVALHEALGNAIIHGNLGVSSDLKDQGGTAFAEAVAARAADPRYAGRFIDIEIVYNGQRCDWVLTQEGPGFDVERVLGGHRQGGEGIAGGGHGILMMRAFVDEVAFCAAGRQITLTMHKAGCPEKRRAERRSVHEVIRVVPVRSDGAPDWHSAHEGVARSLSAGGMGLLQALPAGGDLALLGIVAGGELLYVPAEVRHGRAAGRDLFEVGYRFRPVAAPAGAPPTPDTDAAVATLEQRAAAEQAVPLERRSHRRHLYTARVTLHGAGQREPTPGYARNFSKGGVALITTTPVPNEERVLELPGGGRPLRVRARVVRCTRITDRFYDVAAELLGADASRTAPVQVCASVAHAGGRGA
jgi:anti-sigma regulatory factor (Ser/Thr protein kinase)